MQILKFSWEGIAPLKPTPARDGRTPLPSGGVRGGFGWVNNNNNNNKPSIYKAPICSLRG